MTALGFSSLIHNGYLVGQGLVHQGLMHQFLMVQWVKDQCVRKLKVSRAGLMILEFKQVSRSRVSGLRAHLSFPFLPLLSISSQFLQPQLSSSSYFSSQLVQPLPSSSFSSSQFIQPLPSSSPHPLFSFSQLPLIIDVGASPTSSEPTRKTRDSWTSTNTNFEITLEVVARS